MRIITLSTVIYAAMMACAGFAQGPDPAQVKIQNVAYAGPGCPQGSGVANLSADAQAFTMIFDSFTASVGPGIDPSLAHTNCEISLALSYPSGYTFAFIGVDYRGYASLEANAVGTQRSTYFFEDHLASPPLQTTFQGPVDRDYQSHDDLTTNTVVWAPCSATHTLTINSELNIASTGGAQGLMTIDSVDGEVQHIYNIVWRKCIPTPPNVKYQCSPCTTSNREVCGDWDATNHKWLDTNIVACTYTPTPSLPPQISYRCSPCSAGRQVCGDWDGANHLWVDQSTEGCTMH